MEKLPIGAEGVNDLGKVAGTIMSVKGQISWQERRSKSNTVNPEFDRFARVIDKKRGARRERAMQFFNWCLVEKISPENPATLEKEIEDCVKLLKKKGLV